jgi:hypothetical protein
MRGRSLLAVALVTGLLTLPMLHEAAAVPAINTIPQITPDSSIKNVYYYRGRYYPYRYHGRYFSYRYRGAYFNRRYYRSGRWHYY